MNRAANFDGLAGVYRWMERLTFGRALERCRCAFVDEMLGARSALVIGDGDGRFAARLLEKNPHVVVDAIDASGAMLDALVRSAGAHAGRVRTEVADARTWAARGTYDVIATHFFLDCLTTEEVRELACRLRECAGPSTCWIVSEFAIPEGWFGWMIAKPLVWFLYLAFKVLTGVHPWQLPDHRLALRDAGFVLARERQWRRGLLVSERWVAGTDVRQGTFTMQTGTGWPRGT
ncbi:MAG TPA: class I SAM-dependent methyltransferase [Terracidiphilus sp.]|nr:class I SAM-dependent methyltransferase [Terracidiphilus sp.]